MTRAHRFVIASLSLSLAGLALPACPKRDEDRPRPPEPTTKRDGGAATGSGSGSAQPEPEPVALPPAPPLPTPPAGLPAAPATPGVTREAVALGELLFRDPRLSSTGKTSCASCHDPAHGFASAGRPNTDAGRANLRRAPTLVNLAWQRELGWDGRFGTLADQLASHVRGQLGDDLATAVGRIGALAGYRAQFARAGGPPSAELATTALSAYVLTRYAGSPWDAMERSPDAPADHVAGYQRFQDKAQCATCHTPPLYTDLAYHRLGLIATADEGRGKVDPAQRGAFKTPTLRGAAARGGFFHDGSAPTLDAAIDWHLAGGTGQGADPSIVDPALKKIVLTPTERKQLGAFVEALTDPRDRTAPEAPPLP
ncbi:MAG: cytochrome-c peroxidase [Kofleriaceae bacterium]